MPSYLTFPTVAIAPDQYKIDYISKVKTVGYGDGYTSESPDGINSVSRIFNVGWSNIPEDNKDTIEDFIVARGGFQTFLWTDPVSLTNFKVKCRLSDLSASWVSGDQWNVSVVFKQVFV